MGKKFPQMRPVPEGWFQEALGMDERAEIAARGAHDIGGQDAGPFIPTEHVLLPWEKRTHALFELLSRHGQANTEEKRRAVEDLGKEIYDALTYYERWALAAANILLARGLITSAELAQKMAEIEAREKEHGREVCPQ
jgi:hypothetical protein